MQGVWKREEGTACFWVVSLSLFKVWFAHSEGGARRGRSNFSPRCSPHEVDSPCVPLIFSRILTLTVAGGVVVLIVGKRTILSLPVFLTPVIGSLIAALLQPCPEFWNLAAILGNKNSFPLNILVEQQSHSWDKFIFLSALYVYLCVCCGLSVQLKDITGNAWWNFVTEDCIAEGGKKVQDLNVHWVSWAQRFP